jgi:hypothetical protein
MHRGATGTVTLIEHPVSLQLAELFNTIYHSMLTMLVQYYSYGGETKLQREILRDSSRRIMSAIIRPIAEMLTELPAKPDPTLGNAGPGFELYGNLNLAPSLAARWIILKERFNQHIKDAEELLPFCKEFPALNRITVIIDGLKGSLINLSKEFE